jgi:hypothetical protein
MRSINMEPRRGSNYIAPTSQKTNVQEYNYGAGNCAIPQGHMIGNRNILL